MTTKVFETIGAAVIGALEEVGRYLILVYETMIWLLKPPYRIELLIKQIDFIGVSSLSIILLTGGFTGAVMALQTSHAFRSFDANVMVGPAVALAITRELGPVLSALMIAGRCGSSMAAEIGTMKVTEQIDALHTMAVSPVQYLVVPRVVACTLMIPALTVIFDFIGVFGAWIVSTFLLDVPSKHFYDSVLTYVKLSDFSNGLVKATAFGFIIAVVSCFKGMSTTRGAAGVGQATTESVVVSSVTVLISDYFLTAMLF